MKEYLSAARRKRFCECYLRTLDPVRAAEEAGERDGWALLAEESVRVELDAMRSLRARTVRREDAVRRLAELAFGQANDAVAMALSLIARFSAMPARGVLCLAAFFFIGLGWAFFVFIDSD